MSRAQRKTDEIRETWRIVYARQHGLCAVCSEPMRQLAHVLGQTKRNLQKYGLELIHHPENIRGVCGLAHNSVVSLNPDTQPELAKRHVAWVRRWMETEVEQNGNDSTE